MGLIAPFDKSSEPKGPEHNELILGERKNLRVHIETVLCLSKNYNLNVDFV